MRDACFFHLNFLNARGILAQKIYNASAIFRQSSDVKNWWRPQRPSVIGQLVPVSPSAPELAVLNKADLILQ